MIEPISRRVLVGIGIATLIVADAQRRRPGSKFVELDVANESAIQKMQRVIDALSFAGELSNTLIVKEGGASPESIDEAERILGIKLPASFRMLYEATDGGDFIGGNISLEPILPESEDRLSVATNSGQL